MVVQLFTVIQGYHYSVTIDSVCAPLTDAQDLMACSISTRAYTTSDYRPWASVGVWLRETSYHVCKDG